jgi:hypothetical protein
MSKLKLENIGRHERTEHMFVDQFGGTKVLDLEIQLRGVDVIYKDGVTTIQIKDEFKSSERTGNIFIEKELEDPETGEKIAGCFESEQADKLVILIHHPKEGKPYWLGGSYNCFRKFNNDHRALFRQVSGKYETIKNNKTLGYKYTRPHGEVVKIADLIKHKETYQFVLTPLNKVISIS